MFIHALDGGCRNGLHMSVRVLGQDEIHGMDLIKGLHHLDAITQRTREEHGVVAYPNWTKSNALSCYRRRACCWLEEMACVSSWTGGLQTREPQLALAYCDSKVMGELELVRSWKGRLP